MQQRRRIKHTSTFEERLVDHIQALRQQARLLPPGKLREETLRRARQAETATQINRWLTSPELRPPQR
jgi:hypothetical protein